MIMRPAYNIARFFAKPIRSHPSSKGTAQSSIVPLRPNWSIDHPPTGPPNMAPTVTRDCKENEIGNKVVRLAHRRTGRGGEGGCSSPKFWATQIFWAARENLGKVSF